MKTKRYIVGLGEALWDVLPDGKKLGGAPANFAYHAGSFLGMDNTFAFTEEGALIGETDRTWTAINGQPVVFKQEAEDAPITAGIITTRTTQEHTDLGIAKLHFEIAARACGIEGAWEWGDGGAFVIE